MKTKLFKQVSFVLSVLIISLVAGYAVFAAWIEPSAPPPGANVSAPINIGPDDQTKSGDICTTVGGPLVCLSTVSGVGGVDADWIILGADMYATTAVTEVGIGITNPGTLLHVSGAAPIIKASNPVLNQADSGTIEFTENDLVWGSNTYGFRVGYDGADNTFKILSANMATVNTRMAIERDSGEVGIGTATPSNRLSIVEVWGSQVQFGNAVNQGGYLTSMEADDAFLTSGGTWNHMTGQWIARANQALGVILYNGDIRFQAKTGLTAGNAFTWDEMMRIRSNGRVGIGTTAPSQALDVNGYVRGSTGLCIADDCRTSWPAGGVGGADADWIISGTDMYATTAIDYVGIGTTNPQFELHVYGANNPAISLEGGGVGGREWRFYSTNNTASIGGGKLGLYDGTGGAYRVVLDSAGNLGIGESYPAERLDVNGAIRLGTTANTNTGTIRWTGADFEGYTGAAWVSLTAGGAAAAFGDGDWVISGTDMYATSAVNQVGINDSTPSYALDVNGDIRTTNRLLLGNLAADPAGINGAMYYNTGTNRFRCYENGAWTNCIGGAAAGLWTDQGTYITPNTLTTAGEVQVMDDGRVELQDTMDATGLADTGVLEIANSLRIDGNEIITNTSGILYLQYDNDGDLSVDDDTLYVDNSADRVGISNSGPLERLDVNGAIRLGTTANTNTGTIRWTGADFEGRTATGWISLTAGGVAAAAGDGDWIISGTDMYATSAINQVGINDPTPSYALDVTGDTRTTNRLILGSLAADPAGINGAMYYNTGTNRFRCYQNGAWTNCIGTGAGIGPGTPDFLTKWDAVGTDLVDSIISDDGSLATVGGDMLVSGGNLYVGSTNNQINALSNALEIQSSNAGDDYIELQSNSGTYGVIIREDTTNGGTEWGNIEVRNGVMYMGFNSSVGPLTFTDVDCLRIDSGGGTCSQAESLVVDGRIGINDFTPSYALDVSGDTRTTNRLILGSLGADPVGINGAMYYNTGSNKFRCYQGGAWTDCIGSGTGLPAGAAGQTLRHDDTNWVANSFLYNNGTSIGIGTTGPNQELHVYDGSGHAGIRVQTGGAGQTAGVYLQDTGNTVNLYNVGGGRFDISFASGSGSLTVKSNQTVGINDTTPAYALDVTGDINATGVYRKSGTAGISVNCPAGEALTDITSSGGIVTAGGCQAVGGGVSACSDCDPRFVNVTGDTMTGDLSLGANKLTVGTIDPVYEIDGEKYASYVSDFAGGVRTETSGVVKIGSSRRYGIDFAEQETGSDLWLFWQTSSQDIDDLVILLTPGFNGRAWYKKDSTKLIIYSDRPGEVSYRLTLPREDADEWPNLIED